MTISSAENQMPPIDVVYRIRVDDKLKEKSGWHNQKSTYSLEDSIHKATVYNSYRSAKQAYALHYKNTDRYSVYIYAYTLSPLGVESYSAGT